MFNNLGITLNSETDNTSRGVQDDRGCMRVLGKGKLSNGSVGIYNLTDSSDHIKMATSLITCSVREYYSNMGYYEDIYQMDNRY